MKIEKISLEYQFIVFLYAYLRQIDLSLDRSKWTTFDELREFYKTQINPEKVANYIITNYGISIHSLWYFYRIEELSFFGKIKCLVHRMFFPKSSLFTNELHYCCKLLLILNDHLKADVELPICEIENLRIAFCKLTYGVLEWKLSPKNKAKTMCVEHFSQANTKNQKIEELTTFNVFDLVDFTAQQRDDYEKTFKSTYAFKSEFERAIEYRETRVVKRAILEGLENYLIARLTGFTLEKIEMLRNEDSE